MEVVETFHLYGMIQDVTRVKWSCPGMKNIKTLRRIVIFAVRKKTVVDALPHLHNIYRCRTLLLISGSPPLCLMCNRVGDIRRGCRVTKCTKCRRYGH